MVGRKKIIFYLVQYILDDIYHVASRRSVKVLRDKPYIRAKYFDGKYYEARVIATYPERKFLDEIKSNIVNCIRKVILEPMKDESLTQQNEPCSSSAKNVSNMVLELRTEDEITTEQNEPCSGSAKNVSNVVFECMTEDKITTEPNEPCLGSAENVSNVVLDLTAEDTITTEQSISNEERDILSEALCHKIIILEDILVVPEMTDEKGVESMEAIQNKKASQQKHSCLYCHKLVFKIYRHYVNVHKNEEAVKEIIALPKKTPYRKILLDKLRKNGDYIFNTQLKCEGEQPLLCRRTLKHKTSRTNNVPCPSCKGFYSKYSIRHHLRKCSLFSNETGRRRRIQVECRRLENNIHHVASDVLKCDIFPVLNDDEITNTIRYDEAVIIYANYLCRKYTTPHHATQIRANMRALGRLVLALKKLNPIINCLYDALDVSYVDLIIKGIDKVAGLDNVSNLYKSPATAMLLATELKKLCKLLLMEFIKRKDKEAQKRMEDLYSVFNIEFNVTVNKKGIETQKINSRRRKIVLPKTDHIAQFRIYLENKIEYFINKLEKEFSKEHWTHLAEYTLVHLTIFNRKRPGETQRILIDDYKHYEVIDDEVNAYDSISKEQIKKWARIRFTGKLGKNTALLVHRKFGFQAINLILKYRDQAGVPAANRYIFGEPSQFRTQSTFQACQLIRKFANESGVDNPQLIRTRFLRQHLATETATSNVDDRLEGRVSDFMSHKRKIHEDYYVVTQKDDDIIKVSKLLENFSSTTEHPSSEYQKSPTEYEPPNEIESSSDEDILTKAEVNYALGKSQKRHSWATEEKNRARKYFHEEIYNEKPIDKLKVKQFYEEHKELYKKRTPQLIMQWIRITKEKIVQEEKGIRAKRMRWSTPEREVVKSTTEWHVANGSNPSVADCQLLLDRNVEILKNRNAESIKSYIYQQVKRLSDTSI